MWYDSVIDGDSYFLSFFTSLLSVLVSAFNLNALFTEEAR